MMLSHNGFGRQRGALPMRGPSSLSLPAGNTSNHACGMHSTQRLAPGETGLPGRTLLWRRKLRPEKGRVRPKVMLACWYCETSSHENGRATAATDFPRMG